MRLGPQTSAGSTKVHTHEGILGGSRHSAVFRCWRGAVGNSNNESPLVLQSVYCITINCWMLVPLARSPLPSHTSMIQASQASRAIGQLPAAKQHRTTVRPPAAVRPGSAHQQELVQREGAAGSSHQVSRRQLLGAAGLLVGSAAGLIGQPQQAAAFLQTPDGFRAQVDRCALFGQVTLSTAHVMS